MAVEAVVGQPPTFPITADWGTDREAFDSLVELANTLEFVVEELDSGPKTDSLPRFVDAAERRFRILVTYLETDLCVQVPSGFLPSDLRLTETKVGGDRVIIEHLGGIPHRALRVTDEVSLRVRAVDVASGTPLRVDLGTESEVPWVEFDTAWLRFVDRERRNQDQRYPTRLFRWD